VLYRVKWYVLVSSWRWSGNKNYDIWSRSKIFIFLFFQVGRWCSVLMILIICVKKKRKKKKKTWKIIQCIVPGNKIMEDDIINLILKFVCLVICSSACLSTRSSAWPSFSLFILFSFFFLFYHFVVPCWKFGSPYPGNAQQLLEQRYAFLSVCAVFSCVRTMVWLPVFGIFNVCTDVDACDCTRGLCGHRERVCTESWLLWEINPLQDQGLEPAPVINFCIRSTHCGPSTRLWFTSI